jgi:cytochrome P450 family 110
VRVGGLELPEGVFVLASIYLAHHREATYAQPDVFRPERFLEREPSAWEFLPFGGGVRRCVGAAFALYEMKIVLATIASHFRFRNAARQPVRPVRRTVIVGPSEGARMVMTRRNTHPEGSRA